MLSNIIIVVVVFMLFVLIIESNKQCNKHVIKSKDVNLISDYIAGNTFIVGLCGILIGWFIVLFVFGSRIDDVPSIDVYRGKTELKIEGYYQDSVFIATDSIVVLKK